MLGVWDVRGIVGLGHLSVCSGGVYGVEECQGSRQSQISNFNISIYYIWLTISANLDFDE